MTIAYIIERWPISDGIETVTAALSNELVKRGHQVHILYAIRQECEPMPYQIDSRIKEKKFCSIEYSKANITTIAEYLLDNKVDILINQSNRSADPNLCYEVKKRSGVKLITCWHFSLIPEANHVPCTFKQKFYHFVLRKHLYQKWRERIFLNLHRQRIQKCDHYILLSDSYKREYLKWAGNEAKEDKLDSIPNPLSYSFYYDMCQYRNKKKEVLFIGRIVEEDKRLSYILKIWKEIEADAKLNGWILRIVGDGKDMENTQNLSKQLKLERVCFEGFKDPKPYYEQACIFMMTSAKEGFPMVLVESQQSAVVPIAMDTFSVLCDIIHNETDGIIVNDNNIHGFVESMKELMLNDDYREQLARNGLESCKKYEIGIIADRWEKLFYSHLGLHNSNTK